MRVIQLKVIVKQVSKIGDNGIPVMLPNGTPQMFEQKTSYRSDILNVVGSGGVNGLSTAMLRTRFRIMELIEAVPEGGDLVLSEEDWKIVVDSINNTLWRTVSRDLVEFIDTFTAARKQD